MSGLHSGFHGAAEALFAHLARTSVQVAALFALALVAERLARPWLTPRWRHALWLVVVARLVVPTLPGVPDAGIDWDVAVASPVTGGSATLSPAQADRSHGGPAKAAPPDPAFPRGAGALPVPPTRSRIGASIGSPALSPAESTSGSPTIPFPWRSGVVIAWLAGAAALLVASTARAVRFHRALGRGRPVRDPRVLALVEACRVCMGLARPVAVLETDRIGSPAVTGVLRPRLLLPPGHLHALDEGELRHVVLHEFAHLRRWDVPRAALTHALGCLYWFHPLVWVALARLRAAQESARDWEALAADPSPAPLSYARTLVKLCERRSPALAAGPLPDFQNRGRDLERRILMISQFSRSHRSAGLVGTCLVLALVWAGFTDAGQRTPQDRRAGRPPDLRAIVVEHTRSAPAWRLEIEEALETRVPMAVEDADFPEMLQRLRAATGLNYVVEPDCLEDLLSEGITLTFDVVEARLRDLLTLICLMTRDDLGFGLARGAIYFSLEGEAVEERELRFYRIDPFLDPEYDDQDVGEELTTLVQTFAGDRSGWSWEWEGVSLQSWNDLLVISTVPSMHAHTEAFLNRLLNRGAQPPRPAPAWRERLEAALAEPSQVHADGQELGAVLEELSARHGVPILVNDEDLDWETLTLTLDDVSLETVLTWIAEVFGRRVELANGVVLLSDGLGEMTLEFFEVGPVYAATEMDPSEVRSYTEDFIRNEIDPESWEADPRVALYWWRDQLLVLHTPAVHGRIASLLKALERALQ